MDKYLVLVGDRKGQFFYNIVNTDDVYADSIYSNVTLLKRIFRKILFACHINYPRFYGNWRKLDGKYTKIIIEDATLNDELFDFLRSKFEGAQLIYWFRNSLDAVDYCKARGRNLRHSQLCDKVITFDKSDANRFNFEYIENCYAKDERINCGNLKYDMVFMGTDKSRYSSIIKVVELTEQLGWKNYIHVYSYTQKENKYISHKFVSYTDYLNIVGESKVILDLVDDTYQSGYSLRVFEALFYNKKLITNLEIIKDEPFYHPNNIYVIDLNDDASFESLNSFIELPYEEIPTNIKNLYDFRSWVKRV